MQLPIPKRVSIAYAVYNYIPDKTGIRPIGDKIHHSLLSALTEGHLIALGQHNYRGKREDDKTISPAVWKRYNSTSFEAYACRDNFMREDIYKSDGPFYTNLTLSTEDIDVWLAPVASKSVKTSAISMSPSGGRPTHKPIIYRELEKLKSDQAFWKLNRGPQAEMIAKLCEKSIGDKGWGQKAIQDHIAAFEKEKDLSVKE